MEDKIIIKGARVHNLKNISAEIPKNKLIVFTGVSGSGKSSLAFDTIFAEGQRRYIESLSPYARQFLGQMDKPDVDEIRGLSPAIAIDQRALSHNPRSIVGTLTEIYDYLRILYARLGDVYCPNDGTKIKKLSLEEIVDIIIKHGLSLTEHGPLRKEKNSDKSVGPHESASVMVLSPVVRGRKGEYYQLLYDFLSQGFSEARIDGKFHSLHERVELSRYKEHTIEIVMDKVMIDDPSAGSGQSESRLFEAVENALNYSKGLVMAKFGKKEILLSSSWTCPIDNFSFPEVEPRLFSFNSPHGACETCFGLGKTDLFLKTICPSCEGKRLKPEALSVKIAGKNIYEVTALSIDKAYDFFASYKKKMTARERKIALNVIEEIENRLIFLLEVGLDYLTLNREAETLSGGEAQRIRLASQIGSKLSGTLYVLDEPTIGLHERDTERLISTLKSLRDQNNTVIVVEHDEKTIHNSDYLLDLGPAAGAHGGEITAIGETKKLLHNANPRTYANTANKEFKNSLTLKYLRGEKEVAVPELRRHKASEKIKIVGARANNLKNIDVEFPLRRLVCLTGVSGSGKSSLLYDVLYSNLSKIKARFDEPLQNAARIIGSEYVDKVVMVNQSPIGRTPRSNPATYTGIFTPIRDFFAELAQSREKGYTASRFSFNVKGGRCEACQGAGFNLIEMHFLPPVLVECEVCHGKRFNRETLQVQHNASINSARVKKNIFQILEMTVDEALEFFDGIYTITDKLKVLQEVGLGYIKLGQSATTLSGGEAQRIKLSKELIHPLGKRGLFLLDEPTVGLHYQDIEMLLKVLNKLVERGNTVIVIEHNMHVIKSADYVIDLGPEGGDKGGKLIVKGTPEEIINDKRSVTGKYLKEYFK